MFRIVCVELCGGGGIHRMTIYNFMTNAYDLFIIFISDKKNITRYKKYKKI